MKLLSPSEYIEKIKFIDKDDKLIALTCFISMFVGNLVFILGNAIAHDGLIDTYTSFAGPWELTLGRFMIQFTDYARFGILSKVVIFSLCTIFLIGTVMLIRRIFEVKKRPQIFLLSLLFSITPFIPEILYYTFCADAYFLGIFLSALCVYELKKNKFKNYLLASICIIIFSAQYQAMLGVALGLTVVLAIKLIIEKKEIKPTIFFLIKSGFTFLISLIIYYILAKVICQINGLSIASYQGADSIGLNTFLHIPAGVKKAIKDFLFFYADSEHLIPNEYYMRRIPYLILFAFTAFSTIFISVSNKNKNRLLRFILVFILILALPVAINITDVISPESRYYLLMAIGHISILPLFFVIWQNLSKDILANSFRFISAGCLIYLCWTFFVSNNYTQISKEHTYERFNNFAVDVVSRATMLDDYEDDMPWMFNRELGSMAIDWRKTNGNVATLGIAHDGYFGISRYDRYFKKYLGFNMKIASEETFEKIKQTDDFRKMGVYPAKNSVKIIDNVVVVKTSEEAYIDE